jgi:hypothetical protein
MALIDVYDGAFLHPMSAVPSSVRAIVGYVGGPGAYHVWSTADAQAVRDSGREFWSLWVPPQRALSSNDGTTAANGMIAALPDYHNPKSRPVFLNIEYDAYAANPGGAAAASRAFQLGMHAAGYPRAYSYVPLAAGYGWGARFTYERPSTLPTGLVGIQYENDRYSHPGWDASVFDLALFGTPPAQNTDFLEDLMSRLNYVWWFGRTSDGAIWAVNTLQGTYQRMANAHNLSVFKDRLTKAGVPWKSDQVDVAGDMSQFGVRVDDA